MNRFGIWYITRRSDKENQERRLHAAIPSVLCGIALLASAFVLLSTYWAQIGLFMFVGLTMKMLVLVPLVYVRLTEILPTKKAVPAVAFVGACSNFIGQFGGPVVTGYLKFLGGGHDMRLARGVLGLFSIVGACCLALLPEVMNASGTSGRHSPFLRTKQYQRVNDEAGSACEHRIINQRKKPALHGLQNDLQSHQRNMFLDGQRLIERFSQTGRFHLRMRPLWIGPERFYAQYGVDTGDTLHLQHGQHRMAHFAVFLCRVRLNYRGAGCLTIENNVAAYAIQVKYTDDFIKALNSLCTVGGGRNKHNRSL
nr:hypothetical protein [Pantoea allii]